MTFVDFSDWDGVGVLNRNNELPSRGEEWQTYVNLILNLFVNNGLDVMLNVVAKIEHEPTERLELVCKTYTCLSTSRWRSTSSTST